MARKFFKRRFSRLSRLPAIAKLSFLLTGLLLVLAGLELTNTTHWFHTAPAPTKAVVTAGTPSSSSGSGATTSPPVVEKTPTSNNGNASGTAIDTQGTASSNTNPSQWTISQSGYITVKQPTANEKLKSGSVLSGSAKVSEIHYRLSDDRVGVIADGTLSVVGGNFSGTLQFTPHAATGRLDVFSTDSQGVEYNEVQIYVGF